MKYKIIVDSSSNLKNDYLNDKNIDFSVVPLTLRINEKEYVDDDNCDTNKLLEDLKLSKKGGKSSCPSPNDFYKEINGSDYYLIFTMSTKLSGSFASALISKDMNENNDNIFVLDSKLVSGALELLVIKAKELIKENKKWSDIKNELILYRDSLNLLFILNKFDNLIANGRMSKVTAFVAKLANIKPLCYGEEGEIKIKEKIRTLEGAYKRLAFNITKMCPIQENRICIISHTFAKKEAEEVKKLIESTCHFKEIIIREHKGLCGFYSLEGGIIVSF